ncbi:hypothetical protein KCP70_02895 [Salmonella enterica subsp. enterica]|nr:hypothetical protein KCP70_02895 [Salmonella enterica subsp. enterica]
MLSRITRGWASAGNRPNLPPVKSAISSPLTVLPDIETKRACTFQIEIPT